MREIICRNSAKAIIVKDDKILVLQKQHAGNPVFTVFPGGGQEPGELLHDALIRECREEIGATVKVGELLFVREYRSWEHEFFNPNRPLHQVEFFFLCELTGDLDPTSVENPDPGQIRTLWLDVDELEQANLYPKVLLKHLAQRLKSKKKNEPPIYLGGVN